MASYHVLLTDDCESCRYVSNAFALCGLSVREATVNELVNNAEMAENAVSYFVCQSVEEKNKTQLIEFLNSRTEKTLLIFTHPTVQKEAYKNNIVCMLDKKFNMAELKKVLSVAEYNRDGLSSTDLSHPIFERLVGKSKQIQHIRSIIKQVANCDSTVLILGQSGTGKDVIASCIHHVSGRKSQPLVPINCGAIPGELMESELFGHEKGAFTGALNRRIGRFEMADGGTLFLDEIGDMPFSMQVKLLRIIQERTFERVGGTQTVQVDVRLIAATNKNLSDLIEQNKFREDLFYRLNVFPIQVPTLSERSEDIPLLIDYYLNKIYHRMHHRVEFTDCAMEILCHYPWPGNIRELENFLERMVVMYRDQVLNASHLDAINKKAKPDPLLGLQLDADRKFNLKEHISQIEQQIIHVALARSNGIVSLAADYLSLGRTTLIEKMKKYRILETKEAETV